MTDFLAFLAKLGPALVDLFAYAMRESPPTPEEDERHVRAIIRAAYDARAEREIQEAPQTRPEGS